ncbi:hypothetical protein [Hymenobacter sp. UYCo722]|uniref:hypothetical protein n=1 Tax=Hymenobacter sp. UYCo722 TaxID=3156335 RepID=UPI00339166A0
MLRCLCVLLLLSGPAFGQVASNSPAGGPGASGPAARNTAADTVAALQRLFHLRRAGGVALLVTSGLAVAAGPVIGFSVSGQGGYQGLAGVVVGLRIGAGVALPLTVLGVRLVSRYAKANEAQVLATYQATHALPPRLAKKLRPGLFLAPEQLSPYRYH